MSDEKNFRVGISALHHQWEKGRTTKRIWLDLDAFYLGRSGIRASAQLDLFRPVPLSCSASIVLPRPSLLGLSLLVSKPNTPRASTLGLISVASVMGDSLPLAKPLTVDLKVLGTGNSDKAGIMLSFGFGGRAGERLTYRGYDLEIAKDPIGWRLGVYPSRPELPIRARSNFTVPYPRKDDALSAARERIDLLLSA